MDVVGLSEKLCGVLGDVERGSLAHRLARMSVEEGLQIPLREVLDAEAVADALVLGLRSGGPGALALRNLESMVGLERERASQSGELLREGLPPGVVEGLEQRVLRPSGLPRDFGRNIVDPVFLRSLVASALTETLETFLTRLPFGGILEGDGGLIGSLARKGAGRLKSAGSVLSNLGGGMQDGLKRQAKEFASASADRLKEGVMERFRAVESHQAVESMRHRALASVLDLTLTEVYALADDPGVAVLWEWCEATLAHNLEREEVREAIREQVRCGLLRLKDQTLGELLSEFGTTDIVVEQGTLGVTSLIGSLTRREDFKCWLQDVLGEALL